MFLLILVPIITTAYGQNMDLPPVKSCYEECEQVWCPQDACQPPLWCETSTCEPTTLTITSTLTPTTSVLTSATTITMTMTPTTSVVTSVTTMTMTTIESTTKLLTNVINQTVTKYRPNILTQMQYLTHTETIQETATVTEYVNKVKRNASEQILSTPIYNSSKPTGINPSGTTLLEDEFDVSSGHHVNDDNEQHHVQANVSKHQVDVKENRVNKQVLKMTQDLDLFLTETAVMLETYHSTNNSQKQKPISWFKQPFKLIETHPQFAGNCYKIQCWELQI